MGAITVAVYFTIIDTAGFDERRYITRSLGMLICGTFTLIALFVPKILAIKRIIMAESSTDSSPGSSRITEITTSQDSSEGFTNDDSKMSDSKQSASKLSRSEK